MKLTLAITVTLLLSLWALTFESTRECLLFFWMFMWRFAVCAGGTIAFLWMWAWALA